MDFPHLAVQKGPAGLASITAAWIFCHRAGGWIEKKSAVVGFAIVITSEPEAERPTQNQQRRRKWPVVMMHINEWGVKRRQLRSPLEVSSLKRPEGRVRTESPQSYNHRDDLEPPSTRSRCAFHSGVSNRSHGSSCPHQLFVPMNGHADRTSRRTGIIVRATKERERQRSGYPSIWDVTVLRKGG